MSTNTSFSKVDSQDILRDFKFSGKNSCSFHRTSKIDIFVKKAAILISSLEEITKFL